MPVNLAGAIVVDAVFVSGLFDPFWDVLRKFPYLLQFREDNSTISEDNLSIKTITQVRAAWNDTLSCSC